MIAIANDDEQPPKRKRQKLPKWLIIPGYIEDIAPFDEARFERIKEALLKLGVSPADTGEVQP